MHISGTQGPRARVYEGFRVSGLGLRVCLLLGFFLVWGVWVGVDG